MVAQPCKHEKNTELYIFKRMNFMAVNYMPQ